MTEKTIAQKVLQTILDAGFEKASSRVSYSELHELQSENSDLNLFRTNFETDMGLSGIADHRRATNSINKLDDDSIQAAVYQMKLMADGSNPDPAYDIAEFQEAAQFQAGPQSPDHDKMYDRITELQTYVAATYPTLNLRSAGVSFLKRRSAFLNSNNVSFETQRGQYQVSISFSSKEGTDTSSMMYTGYSSFDLDQPIHEAINVDTLLRQSTEQLRTRHIPAKFVGDLIMTPDCVMSFLGFLTQGINDAQMIAGTSYYKNKLSQQVASELLTLDSQPRSDALCGGYWLTADGYAAKNCRILENGVLKSYLLGLYGANKTGLERSPTGGGCYVLQPGDIAFEDMVAGVKEGILMTRFSGGRPNDRGDFSGIAKNSYYIKDGKISFPIRETTVSGNIVSLLNQVNAVSRETLNDGSSILPWVRTSGVTVS